MTKRLFETKQMYKKIYSPNFSFSFFSNTSIMCSLKTTKSCQGGKGRGGVNFVINASPAWKLLIADISYYTSFFNTIVKFVRFDESLHKNFSLHSYHQKVIKSCIIFTTYLQKSGNKITWGLQQKISNWWRIWSAIQKENETKIQSGKFILICRYLKTH